MSDIEFQEDQDFLSQQLKQQSTDKTPAMSKKLMAWGLAKDAEQANMYLLGVAVIVIAITVFVFLSTLRGPATVEIDPSMMPADGEMMGNF